MLTGTAKNRMEQKFGGRGAVTVEELAAALYTAFHGCCECATHPFYYDRHGEFCGYLPWEPGDDTDDPVVNWFRESALAAHYKLIDQRRKDGVR